jgi:hypothetical protein
VGRTLAGGGGTFPCSTLNGWSSSPLYMSVLSPLPTPILRSCGPTPLPIQALATLRWPVSWAGYWYERPREATEGRGVFVGAVATGGVLACSLAHRADQPFPDLSNVDESRLLDRGAMTHYWGGTPLDLREGQPAIPRPEWANVWTCAHDAEAAYWAGRTPWRM